MAIHGNRKVMRRQTSTPRNNTATIAELATHGAMDPSKLLACVKETHPTAKMQSPITAGALRLAFSNYEQAYGVKQSGDPAPKMSNGAPAARQPEQIKHEVNTMSTNDDGDFYDEFATDAESKKQWENDPGIRAEFFGDYEAFKHFRRAEAQGLIKILGSK